MRDYKEPLLADMKAIDKLTLQIFKNTSILNSNFLHCMFDGD